MSAAVADSEKRLRSIPLRGLAGREPVPFPLYLSTGDERFVLYQPADRNFDRRSEDRLLQEGISALFIRERDRRRYSRRIETVLDAVLRENSVVVEDLAMILQGVAHEVTTDLLSKRPDADGVARARAFMGSTASLVVRDRSAFAAIRDVLGFSAGLVDHSVCVGMLSLGVARRMLGSDPATLMNAGLAGLLHDVGRVGEEVDAADPAHAERGFHLLRGLRMPNEVCDAALHHHERFDGSGFPDGLAGQRIPRLVRVVGMMDNFHHLLSEAANGSVFDALRIQAQVYRGCFDPTVAAALVSLFADRTRSRSSASS